MKYSLVLLSSIGARIAYETAPVAPPPVEDPVILPPLKKIMPLQPLVSTSATLSTGTNSVSVGCTETKAAGAASGENMAFAAAAVTPAVAIGFPA